VRVGTVINQEGDLYTVKWDDNDTEQEVHLGDYETLCSRSSLVFLSLVDPDALRAAFDQNPTAITVQALRESATPMTGKDLKTLLTGYGVEDQRFRSAWITIRKQLTADTRLTVDGTGAGTTFAYTDAEQGRQPSQ
jgi:hypothetical protein